MKVHVISEQGGSKAAKVLELAALPSLFGITCMMLVRCNSALDSSLMQCINALARDHRHHTWSFEGNPLGCEEFKN